jgi:hypothetical protein
MAQNLISIQFFAAWSSPLMCTFIPTNNLVYIIQNAPEKCATFKLDSYVIYVWSAVQFIQFIMLPLSPAIL